MPRAEERLRLGTLQGGAVDEAADEEPVFAYSCSIGWAGAREPAVRAAASALVSRWESERGRRCGQQLPPLTLQGHGVRARRPNPDEHEFGFSIIFKRLGTLKIRFRYNQRGGCIGVSEFRLLYHRAVCSSAVRSIFVQLFPSAFRGFQYSTHEVVEEVRAFVTRAMFFVLATSLATNVEFAPPCFADRHRGFS